MPSGAAPPISPRSLLVLLGLLPLLAAAFSSYSSSSSGGGDVLYRQGEVRDILPIAATLAGQLMNPLSLDPGNFLVAFRDGGGGEGGGGPFGLRRVVGFGQIRPLGPALADPSVVDARPGSGDVEIATDEEIWAEFEDDETFPPDLSGIRSLPWSREYRQASASAAARRERRAQVRREIMAAAAAGGGAGQLWELASVYVVPECRGRGRGGGARPAPAGRAPRKVRGRRRRGSGRGKGHVRPHPAEDPGMVRGTGLRGGDGGGGGTGTDGLGGEGRTPAHGPHRRGARLHTGDMMGRGREGGRFCRFPARPEAPRIFII